MRLWLTHAHVHSIVQHAINDSPREACGIIAGNGEQAQKIVSLVNAAADPEHFFQIDNDAFDLALRECRADGSSLVGIYHSHPRGEPILSQTDIDQAPPLNIAQVLVGLQHREPRLAAWHIHNQQIERVELFIGDDPPNWEPRQTLSRAQKAAIIASAVLAFILVLIISLSLLPPAPIIVTATPSLP